MNIYLTTSNTFRRISFIKLQLLLLFSILNFSTIAQEPQPEEQPLNIGVMTERNVSGSAIHGYVVQLKKGQVLRVNLIEKGFDARARILKVSNQQPVSAIANSGKGGFMQESLTMIADEDGVYELVIIGEQVTDTNQLAKYELASSLDNTAGSNDLQRIQGEKLQQEVTEITIGNDKGKFPLAMTKLDECIKIWRQLGDKYREGVAKMQIGDFSAGLQDFGKAESNFLEALNSFDKVKNKAEIGYIYAGLAAIYIQTKNEEKGRNYINQSLEIFRNLGDRRLEKLANTLTLSNLSGIDEVAKNNKLPNLDAKLKDAKTKSERAAIWAKIIVSYALNDDGEEDRPIFERAEKEGLPLIREISNRDLEAQILVGLGIGFSQLGNSKTDQATQKSDAQKSKSYLIQGLALSKVLNNQIFEGLAYVGLNMAYYDDDQEKLAVYFGKRFINSIQNFRQALKAADKETQQQVGKEFEGLYGELATQLISQDRLPEVLQVLNLARDQEFYDFSLFINQPSAKLDLTPREAENEPLFDNLLNKFTTKYSAGAAAAAYQSAINEIQSVFNTLEQNFAGEASGKDIVSHVKDFEDMQDSLKRLNDLTGKKHVSIYYFHDPEEKEDIQLLLITAQNIMLFSGSESEKDILEFLDILQSPADGSTGYDPRPLGGKIYENIFKAKRQIKDDISPNSTLEKELANYGADVIHWSLAGKIRYIPIAALYDNETGQYLVEKYENVVFTRARKERFLAEPKPWLKGIGFGTSMAYPPFRSLPGVIPELAGIFGDKATNGKGNFEGPILLNTAFNQQALLAIRQSKPDFIHIASHFVFEPGDAQKSYLLLGDGTHFSLLDMKMNIGLFDGVDLLTLSACQTAAQQADEATGKEVDGLAEVTQYLGVKSVTATLWSINDEGTSKLMSEFYRLKKVNPEVSKSEALRLAQLSLLNGKSTWKEGMERRIGRGVRVPVNNSAQNRIPFTPDKESPYEHPYYWAPFVFYGSSTGKVTSDYILSKPQPKPRTGSSPVSENSTGTSIIRPADFVGTWEGLFDTTQYACALDIERVDGNTFYGKLRPQGAVIEVIGSIDTSTNQISFFETRIVSLGNNKGWTLGTNRGTFTNNGNSLSGTGAAGNVTYNWSFWKKGAIGSATGLNSAPNINRPTVTMPEIEASFKSNLFDDTIRQANIFLQTTPDSKEAMVYLGLSYLLKKDVDNAVDNLEKAVRLGQPVTIPLKRIKIIIGHTLENVNLVIGAQGVAVVAGDKVYFAKYSELTDLKLNNYTMSFLPRCNIVFFKGLFTETQTKSEKQKQDKKEFDLFPMGAYLQPTNQGTLIINLANCTNQEDYMMTAIVKLMSRLSVK